MAKTITVQLWTRRKTVDLLGRMLGHRYNWAQYLNQWGARNSDKNSRGLKGTAIYLMPSAYNAETAPREPLYRSDDIVKFIKAAGELVPELAPEKLRPELFTVSEDLFHSPIIPARMVKAKRVIH